MFTSAVRVTRFALQNFWRDIWLSVVTIVIFVLAITLVSTLSGVKVVADTAIGVLRSKVDVTVAFTPTTPEKTVLELKQKLEALPETSLVTYFTAADNQRIFIETHADDQVINDAVNAVGSNPFGPSLKIQARSLDEYPKISKVLEDQAYQPFIASDEQSLGRNQAGIEQLSSFTRNVNRFSLVLTLVFSVIAILVVVNTVRIAIYTHREEIGIMKLVGATNWFVRAPFLVESVLVGLLAIVLACLLLLTGIGLLAGWFNDLFRGFDVNMAEYFRQNFLAIFWGPLAGSLVISIVSAGIAVGRYVKV